MRPTNFDLMLIVKALLAFNDRANISVGTDPHSNSLSQPFPALRYWLLAQVTPW